MAPVVAVQFHRSKGRLFSLSRDRVLRVWDVPLQVCLQRMTGVFPKGLDVFTRMLFHEDKLRLFLTFNNSITMLEMKMKVRDRVFSHEKPLVGVIFNTTFNQVVSACQGGTISFWLIDTGQRVKNISRSHNDAELTCLAQDPSGSRFYTGSTDGTIKIWDMNGHCHHTLVCFGGAHAEVGQVVILKRAVLVTGSSNHFTVFRTTNFRDHYVYPSEWKGGPEHCDDVLTGIALPPNGLITGSYDGELVVWNTNSELAARRMTQRCKRMNEEHGDFLFNISRVMLLSTRKHISSGSKKGASLVSCGGNGIVRFWNPYACVVIGEFIAHAKSSNIIMAIDSSNEFLATGDIEGKVKIWNIREYCMYEGEEEVYGEPELLSEWIAHVDLISGLAFCKRFERKIFLVIASTDCGVTLWTIEGVKIGVFGQEARWKLELYHRDPTAVSLASTETTPAQETIENVVENTVKNSSDERDSLESMLSDMPEFRVENIAPFPEDASLADIRKTLSTYHISAWKHTLLGKEYQEVRMRKRQRKQPKTIEDLPAIAGEQFGKPIKGPYCYLNLSSMAPVEGLEQPDFMEHPEEYFMNKEDLHEEGESAGLSALLDGMGINQEQHNSYLSPALKNTIDEQTLFPNSVLQFEEQMKRTNQFISRNTSNNCTPSLSNRTPISKSVRIQDRRNSSDGNTNKRLPPLKVAQSKLDRSLYNLD